MWKWKERDDTDFDCVFTFMDRRKKVLVIGLDCAPPELVFEQWLADLPNLARLMNHGVWGRLESCIPPITVPAWSSMMASKDPGVLGCYGFRNRVDYSYGRYKLANATDIQADRVWDLLSRAGKKVITIGVPQTYPPSEVNGIQVGCFLSPSTTNPHRPYTYPSGLMQEIEQVVGNYLVDVPEFRTADKSYLLDQIYLMTERRLALVRKWLVEKEWDFFMFVEMGTDRIHHGFWSYYDQTHPRHEAHPLYRDAIHDYYCYLDTAIGQILALLDDDTTVCVVSDHGAKSMLGGICINEWLMREGYLVLKALPEKLTPIDQCEIDWKRTRAWSDGGYYARIFLNVLGREPQGQVPPSEVDALCVELQQKLENLTDPAGVPLGTRIFRPGEVYRACNGVPPDLIAYLGDLSWRSVGSLGYNSIYTFENDTGPDECNHASHGIVIKHDPDQVESEGGREVSGLQLMDIAPMLLQQFSLPVPSDMQGRPF